MQINEMHQLNDNQQTHSSKVILDKIRGSGGHHSLNVTSLHHSDCSCHTTTQFTVHHCFPLLIYDCPDSKVHGDNKGPNWVLSAPDGSHVGPMNLTIRVVFGRQATEGHTKVSVNSEKTLHTLAKIMMTSSNGNIFRVTGPSCGEFSCLQCKNKLNSLTHMAVISANLRLSCRGTYTSGGTYTFFRGFLEKENTI